METFPIFIAVPILVATYKRYTLTPLLYRLLFLHALILMVGGHYTYAEVPLGYWMQDWFGFARNNYDKIGHLALTSGQTAVHAGGRILSRRQRQLRTHRMGGGRDDG